MFWKKNYKYFVSYAWYTHETRGHGCTEIIMDSKIKHYDHISEIVKHLNSKIRDNHGNSATCAIINYKRL